MCVIAYKPLNKAFMAKSTLETCFKNNPDGAGFMFSANGKVHIRKGFMSFNDFWAALNATRSKYGDSIPYVMHFRISTQAGVNQQCCHPYPLSWDMDKLKLLSTTASIGIAHNGIISLTSNHAVTEYNDTMKFITDYATLLIRKIDWWKNPNIATALKVLCGSKLAIMGSDNHVELIGDFIKDKGCYYSNGSYENKIYNTQIFDDPWEQYWDRKREQYDFDETFCPLSMESDDCYCFTCKKRGKCKLLQNFYTDYEELYRE